MSKFTYHIAEQDLAFLVGLNTEPDSFTPGFAIKVKKGQPCILYENHNVIRFVNPEDHDCYENAYAIATNAIGGFDGVFADDIEEALHLLADWAQLHAPGLVMTFQEAVAESDGREDWAQEFYGPVGNECLYFTERGQGQHQRQRHDCRLPADRSRE